MSEEREFADLAALSSGAAWSALGAASREKADSWLDKQGRLLDLQIDNLEKLDAFETSHLRWRRFNDQMSGALQIMLVLIGAAIVIGLAAVVWSASQDDGLVIESFSVPPDMATRGLDGQVVASQLLDKLALMQKRTVSFRPARSFANNWGNDIKVQIPETGISAGEAYRFLVQWLGHETHVTGEMFRTGNGITLTARVGGGDGATFSGAEGDLDALEQKAAEQIYAQTQPYRYAAYQIDLKHYDKAKSIFLALADNESSTERAWAQLGLGSLEETIPSGNEPTALDHYRRAVANDPDLNIGWNDINGTETVLGHDEARLPVIARIMDLDAQGKVINARCAAINDFKIRGDRDALFGDYQGAVAEFAQGEALPGCRPNADFTFISRMAALALGHRAAAAEAEMASLPADRTLDSLRSFSAAWQLKITQMSIALALHQWKTVAAEAPEGSGNGIEKARQLTAIRPLLAFARAGAGDMAAADALIAPTPLDCYFCVRARGQIAATEKNWSASAHWFESATKVAPSLPTAYSEWGEMLLRKGDFDGAIAKFTIANQKGPHFADPLEMWGEALIAKNRSDLALAKFAQANQYAPQWGRLHLKWGEALLWAGDKDGAAKQFAIARTLDLSPAETAALAGLTAHG